MHSSSENILEIRKLNKSYGNFTAISEVSFTLKSGEVLGYLGPNGAGKTTTLNILGGVIPKTGGDIYYRNINLEPQKDINYKKHIGYLPEDASIYEHFTVKEAVEFYYDIYELEESRKEMAFELLSVFGLSDSFNRQIYGFSKGMKQKLLFTLTIMSDPEILLLDEPLASMDAESTIIVREIIKELKERGKAILFSSHILEVIEKVCDRVVILDRGRVIAQGTMDEIIKLSSLEEFFTQLAGKNAFAERIEKARKLL